MSKKINGFAQKWLFLSKELPKNVNSFFDILPNINK